MKSSTKNIRLNSYDDIFTTQETRIEDEREKVMEIPINDLHVFKNHPFKVLDDAAMQDTVESIKVHGVLVPAIARLREKGGYELISGHRRKRACELAGMDTMPVIVRDLNDDEATIIMVNSNIQREHILPSERAFAYKMKLGAMKRQAGRPSKNSRQLVGNLESAEIVGQGAGESGRQVQRYIRLTELLTELLDMVDTKKIAFNSAVELSYLKPEEQAMLIKSMESEQVTPSLTQARRLKESSQEGHLTYDCMLSIISEEQKNSLGKITISVEKIKKFFPQDYNHQKMEEVILELLKMWQKQEQRAKN